MRKIFTIDEILHVLSEFPAVVNKISPEFLREKFLKKGQKQMYLKFKSDDKMFDVEVKDFGVYIHKNIGCGEEKDVEVEITWEEIFQLTRR